ncbi:translation initiation factor IF-2-like [Sciurus carolinensis]|uniref:translation initiation factor IF-2-like n=1 Tax=Sciurus carolinensis TaxID=30640 RepID=UPI001FB4BFF5|nr:translation initiation factor IF-2-like [Sciurus carolinensis]
MHPRGWGPLATCPAVTQLWQAGAQAWGPGLCGTETKPRSNAPSPGRAAPAAPLGLPPLPGAALAVARQAGPAAAAVGSRPPAARRLRAASARDEEDMGFGADGHGSAFSDQLLKQTFPGCNSRRSTWPSCSNM